MNEPLTEWHVYVHMAGPGTGYIGTVMEAGEDNARCAALSRFSREGDRPPVCTHQDSQYIYENDDFDVRPVQR